MPPNAHLFEAIRYERKTDLPGVFRNGVGWEDMRAGDVTYLVQDRATGLVHRACMREPCGVWVSPESADWIADKEQTAVPYDWFESMK